MKEHKFELSVNTGFLVNRYTDPKYWVKEVSESIEQMGRSARTITIKLRWPDFTTITRQKTVPGEIHKSEDIYKVAKVLLYENWEPGKPIRLLGISASRLGVSDQQKLNLEFE